MKAALLSIPCCSQWMAIALLLLCGAPLVRTDAFSNRILQVATPLTTIHIPGPNSKRRSLLTTRRHDAVAADLEKTRAVIMNHCSGGAQNADSTMAGTNLQTDTQDTKQQSFLQRIEGIVFVAYVCNVMALSIPVLLVPIAATEHYGAEASLLVAAQVAKISSVASLGGFFGKFVNGFICKEYGSYVCSQAYLIGLGACSLAFAASQSASAMGFCFAGMEFFASIQWAALAVMLANYYERQPLRLAAAMTALGLSSSSGQILAKLVGMSFATALHWRVVAGVGAAVAFVGAAVISTAPGRRADAQKQREKAAFQWTSVTDSLKIVMGSGLFWAIGFGHAVAFVAKNTDRILGTFFHEMASWPQSICGGLTLSITLGLIHGLVTGSKKFSQCADLNAKRNFLKKRYLTSIAATLGLVGVAMFGTGWNRFAVTGVIAALSSVLASNIAFQYFQFPSMIAQKFGDHKAVVISFMDGFGFLLSAPIFAILSKVVPAYGWSAGWGLQATLSACAAVLMIAFVNPILNLTKTDAESKKAAA